MIRPGSQNAQLLIAARQPRMTETALELAPDLTYEEWEEIGQTFGRAHRASGWWIGDWINYGEETGYVSSETYDRAEAITEIKRKTLREYAYVARRYPSSIRMDDLAFKHHQVVAARPENERVALLDRARENAWSTRELSAAASESSALRRFDPQTKRQHEIAGKAARRLNKALGGIHGYCLGLASRPCGVTRKGVRCAQVDSGNLILWLHYAAHGPREFGPAPESPCSPGGRCARRYGMAVSVERTREDVTLSRDYARALANPHTTDGTRAAIHASIERVSTIPAEIRDLITFRQADVLALLLEALTNKQIGERLGITDESVKGYIRHAQARLGAHGRLELVIMAVRAGWRPTTLSGTGAATATAP